ncbi:GRP family sugar transporter [Companilactobacillus allii]|uniref:Sugar transporter n=1 Tax=Companilactobacillus allii TaxID=1847728 RepID=A0A1P8Q1H5_9LACO|nr:GRP family sugar transporter [Companilactobacillus allii]APX71732.1 sugar transporter [Companilactobacillus allii]USQ68819.1 GRP family sugar transporter [Companilactobacillus allii]
MNIVLMLLPAIAWGILPLAIAKIGGRPINQIMGTALGTLIAGIIMLIITRPNIDLRSSLLAALAGAFWVIGQLGQYTGYEKIGVSKTMPISTGLQLVGTSLIGVLIFGEWSEATARIVGAIGIVLLVVGVLLTSIRDNKGSNKANSSTGTIVMLVCTTLGYLVYNAIPRALSSSGLAIFLPESIGMVVAVLIYIIATRQYNVLKESSSFMNIIGGLVFSIAAITYILSVNRNGVNSAFVVSQLSVVISTVGGMVFLHERRTKKESYFTLSGLGLILVGAIVTTLI